MVEVFLSLGSNVDREKHIPHAIQELDELFGPLTVSSIYESEAVGFAGDPFFNLALRFQSELPAREIARTLREIEIAHGRRKDSRKFEPRTLDIDLVIYGDQVLDDGELKLPREETAKFAFILEPLAEIAPDFPYPGLEANLGQLWADFDKSQVRQEKVSVSRG